MTPESSPLLIVAAVVVASLGLVVTIALLASRYQRRRTEELTSLAYSLGYEFEEKNPDLLVGELARLPFFQRGRRGRVRNVFRRRREGRETLLFDYSYTTGGGQHSATHRQTLLAVGSESRALPAFELRPEYLVHRIGEAFGLQDIDFDDSPGFSKAYLLRGGDEEAVRSLFSGRVRQALEEQKGWSIEGQDRWLILTRHGKVVGPADTTTFLQEAERLASLVLEPS